MIETDDSLDIIIPKASYKPDTKTMISNPQSKGTFFQSLFDRSKTESEFVVVEDDDDNEYDYPDRQKEEDLFLSEDFIKEYIERSFRTRENHEGNSGDCLYQRIRAQAFLQTSAIKTSTHMRQQAQAQRWLHQKGESTLGWEKNEVYIKRSTVFQLLRDKGIVVIKHPRKGEPRQITLRMSRKSDRFLVWRGKGRRKRRFDLHTIDNIYKGQSTVVFDRTGEKKNEDKYISIQNSERILDLEMESEMVRDNFIEVIEFVMTWEANLSTPNSSTKQVDRWKNNGYQSSQKVRQSSNGHISA